MHYTYTASKENFSCFTFRPIFYTIKSKIKIETLVTMYIPYQYITKLINFLCILELLNLYQIISSLISLALAKYLSQTMSYGKYI